jgi:urease accessory protein
MQIDPLVFLQLAQLADSALPIGSTAHSFGLETLVAEGGLTVELLETFLQDYLQETGTFESTFCRLGYRLTTLPDMNSFTTQWLALNARLSAYKTARESRTASATLGRRFLQLVQGLQDHPQLRQAIQVSKDAREDIHYSTAFGLVGSILEIEEDAVVFAHLQQTLLGLVSACQRLLPLGQSWASSIVWHLKPALIASANHSAAVALNEDEISLFTPLLDGASMRHPALTTRLFIS